jgi:hypothetical protein
MNNLHRGHSIDASYQVSVQAVSKEKIKKNQPIRNKKQRIACGGHVW